VTSPPFAPPSRNSLNDNFSQVSPQFALAWHFTPQQMAYGSVARGFRAGGFNQTSPPGSERYGTSTAGIMRSDLSPFGSITKWKPQSRFTTSIGETSNSTNPFREAAAPPFSSITQGGGEQGVEFEGKWRPMPGWDLFGSVGYTDAKFLSDSLSQGVSVGGNHLPYAPTFTGNVGTPNSPGHPVARPLFMHGPSGCLWRFRV